MLMLTVRKALGTIRGKSTPFQVLLAGLLGGILGFMPGFWQAPGLLVAVLLLVIVLNANLFIAGIVAGLCKLLAIFTLPVSFAVGRALLDGPTQPLFRWLINAPVFALFGLEHYVTTGGALLGAVVGAGLGLVAVIFLRNFRLKMKSLEEGSERYQKWSQRWWIRATVWIVAGSGKGKQKYDQILSKRIGNPFRMLGVVFALLFVALLVIVQLLAAGPIVTAMLRHGLEQANGATVDLESAELDLRSGRLTLTGLAMADPNALETNLFSAGLAEGDISGADLLRRRLAINTVIFTDAATGEKRAIRGSLVRKPPKPSDPLPPEERPEGSGTLDDYLEQAEQWKQRLRQLREWYENMSGPEEPVDQPTPEQEESFRDWLEREIAERGYANVRAAHLIEGSPTLLVKRIEANEMTSAQLPDETLDVTLVNVSTQPWLVPEPPRASIRSSQGTLDVDLVIGRSQSGPKTDNTLAFHLRNLDTDKIARDLKIGGDQLLTGGVMGLSIDSAWDPAQLNLPVRIMLNNVALNLPGLGQTRIKELPLTVAVVGPMDNPSLRLHDANMGDQIKSMMEDRADQAVREGTDRLLDEGARELRRGLGEEQGGALGDAARRLLGGRGDRNDSASPPAETNEGDQPPSDGAEGQEQGNQTTQPAEERSEQDRLRDAGRGLLRGLIGRESSDQDP